MTYIKLTINSTKLAQDFPESIDWNKHHKHSICNIGESIALAILEDLETPGPRTLAPGLREALRIIQDLYPFEE
jgi:hypothetical protein